MKTKEELKALKKEVETLNNKFAELTEEELAYVAGGSPYGIGEKVEDDSGENINWEQLIEG